MLPHFPFNKQNRKQKGRHIEINGKLNIEFSETEKSWKHKNGKPVSFLKFSQPSGNPETIAINN